ncbi:cytochrome c biogenesis factor [Rhizomicrobium palustre]|uniref:Cytochrome c biogenesis factor n=1 Tax=Rhizomicrobium palustre TaxID=189966 RepID=A0A846N3I0_9PROT|nr:hypothetical protein [Rhizomicrobium palustre]NIK90069.1 cytochrome c biogenesis factor [Rhizomicrobium palustre]
MARTPVLLAIFLPVVLAALVYMGAVFIDDRFGPHVAREIIIAFLALAAVLAIAFRRFLLPEEAPGEGTILSTFWVVMGAAALFFADAGFEAFVYPAFALHGFQPLRFAEHGMDMVVFGLMLIAAGFVMRRQMLRALKEK